MKQIYISFLLLLAAFAMPESMVASDFYKSTLMSTGNIKNSAIQSGTVSYDAATATLTLDNVVADGPDDSFRFDSATPSITIKLIGNNVLRSSKGCGFYMRGGTNVLLTSDCGGTLKIESLYEAIDYNGSQEGSLTIKDCSVTAAGSYGVLGYFNGTNTQSFNLIVNNSTVTASGAPKNATIRNLKTLQLIDCHIAQPAGAEFGYDDSHYNSYVYVVENDKKVAVTGTVIIVPGGGEAPVVETCEDPVISIKDGKIVATTATEGATCHISYSFTGANSGSASAEFGIPSNVKLEVNAYASAAGKNPSHTVSKTFDYSFGPKGDVSGDGVLSVEDVTKLVDELLNK